MSGIIAIDQSTSASKVFLVNEQGEICRRYAKNHKQYYPKPGHVEHDAEEIWQNVLEGIQEASKGINDIVALAISNQRETTVLWERASGKPVMPAIVWQDVRGEGFCRRNAQYADLVAEKTGLQLSPYYPAAKAASVLEKDAALLSRVERGEVCIGTVDSYLIYRMTGGENFKTDVSNASRTCLFNLKEKKWDQELCEIFGIPMHCLPEVLPSDEIFGDMLHIGIPITGVMGDSHAALFGQGCLKEGMAKATFGTGSSVMMNIGSNARLSRNGLSTSVGFGFRGDICYVLEGNITSSGDTLCWLRDEAQIIEKIEEAEILAKSVADTEGVYLVPAFSGLGAPYFDGNARAAIVGMNRHTTRAHIVRAALESMAYQEADIASAMQKDTGKSLMELRVDGGPTRNAQLMQMVSDLLSCRVQCAKQSELSALGAAYMAGLRMSLFTDFEAIPAVKATGSIYLPEMDEQTRENLLNGWNKAVSRCM